VGIAAYALSFLAGPHFPQQVGINHAGLAALLTHVIAGGTALLLGPWQFVAGIRTRWPLIHRLTGRVYVIAVLISGTAGAIVALGTANGPVARWGFFALAIVWLTTTALGYRAARARDFVSHRRWMIRSFAMAFAAVTLRVYLPIALASGASFAEAYPLIAWACWVPNLIVVEFYLRTFGYRAFVTAA
jgi:uncharacterized membrane protein